MDENRDTIDARPTTFLTVAYDGAPFHGFQRQEGLPTVQGAIEEALGVVTRREVAVTGAGRTDAGVHALGQVVSFESAATDPAPAALRRSLDALSPEAIAIKAVRTARPGASARFDATARAYRYHLAVGPVAPVFSRGMAWHVPTPLDRDAMNEAAASLVGEHDFRSFCVTASAEGKRTVRDLSTVAVTPVDRFGEPLLEIRVEGTSFLHSMVRVIVGSLVEVGRGARQAAWLGEALAACDRSAAGPTAPPHGLVLWGVDYPDDLWLPDA
jgi:tRNA pseudouridine38-40 synthase